MSVKNSAKRATIANVMRDIDKEMMEDAANAGPSPDKLTQILGVATDLRSAQHKLAQFEQAVVDTKAEVRRLEQEILPALFDEAGVQTLGLTDEETLIREQEVYTSIAAERMGKACEWLDANNHGSIIKTSITIPIERGAIKQRDQILRSLVKAKIPHTLQQGIHHSTLAAFGRECVAAGTKLPKDIAVHVQPVVHIKKAKAKGARTK